MTRAKDQANGEGGIHESGLDRTAFTGAGVAGVLSLSMRLERLLLASSSENGAPKADNYD